MRAPRLASCAAVIMTMCWLAGPVALFAQGGKAEPIPIRFARGQDSATLRGTLRGDAQREYAFVAKKGQHLTIKLSAVPPRSIVIDAAKTAGGNLPLAFTGQTASLVLPADGQYEISLKRVSSARGRSEYVLRVTVR